MAKNEEEYEDGPTEITSEDPSEENYSESMTDDGFSTEAISQADDDTDDDDEGKASNSSKKTKKSSNKIVYLGIGGFVVVGIAAMGFIFLSGSNTTTNPNVNPRPVTQQQSQQMNGDFPSSNLGNQNTSSQNNDPFANSGQAIPESSQNQNLDKGVAFPNMPESDNVSENVGDASSDLNPKNQMREQEQQTESDIKTAEDFQAQLDRLNQSQVKTSNQTQTDTGNAEQIEADSKVSQSEQDVSNSSNDSSNASSQTNNYDLDKSDNEGLDLVDASAFRELKEKVGSLEKKFNSFQKYFKKEMTTVINRLDNDDKAINRLENNYKGNSSKSNAVSKTIKRPAQSASTTSNKNVSGNIVQVIRDEPKYTTSTSSVSSTSKVEEKNESQSMVTTKKKTLASYQIQAIIPGRVWLKTAGSGAMSYTVGDLVDSSRRVSSIDAKSAKVVLSDGTVVE